MRKFRHPALALFVLAILSPTAALGQAEKVGVVTTLEGSVTARRAVLPLPVPLKFKDDVFFRDTITTGDQSLARVLLGGKSIVTIRERSVVTITESPGPLVHQSRVRQDRTCRGAREDGARGVGRRPHSQCRRRSSRHRHRRRGASGRCRRGLERLLPSRIRRVLRHRSANRPADRSAGHPQTAGGVQSRWFHRTHRSDPRHADRPDHRGPRR